GLGSSPPYWKSPARKEAALPPKARTRRRGIGRGDRGGGGEEEEEEEEREEREEGRGHLKGPDRAMTDGDPRALPS
ncbi:MAG: hypothetical protein R6V55_00170, partial [Desulfovermiculus sp.]